MKYTTMILGVAFSVFGPAINLHAQNVTSPYSILGIGDVDTKDFGRYFATGNASIARRDAASYNFSNPASLTSLPYKTMNFDIAMRGRSSHFLTPDADTSTGVSKDFVVKRVSMAFRVGQKTAIAFGLMPYSSVNYKYNENKIVLDGNTTYAKSIEGSGSINQVYFSLGKSFGKRFSAGITASGLFGSLERVTQYSGTAIDLSIVKTELDSYTGAKLQGGLQYFSLAGKKWQHLAGLTFSKGTNLTGQLATDYKENEVVMSSELEEGRKFKLPATVALAYTATLKNRLSFSVQAEYQDWPYQKVNYSNSYTNPSVRLSFGMEYSGKEAQMNFSGEKYYLGWGASMESSYLRIKNNYLWDYSASFGGGLNVSRGFSVYTGLEIGTRGNKTYGQIKENYTQYIIGITLKDIWVGPKVFRRYN